MALSKRNIDKSISVVNSLTPGALRTTSANGTAVDLAGYRKAAVVIVAGAVTDGTHTISIEESDASGSGFAAVPADQLSGTPGAVAANTNQEIGYLGTKRYIRAITTVTGSPSTGAPSGLTSTSSVTRCASAIGRSAAALSAAIAFSDTASTGRRCSVISMRLSDIRSSTSRRIRPASRAMMARKRSRASASSRAWFCSVSI